MHPVLKRILINGGLTAALLALMGLLFARMATIWAGGTPTRPGAVETGTVHDSIHANVPLMMAFWGFVFVAVGELIRWRLGGKKPVPVKTAESHSDEAEKLLNELLAQAESKMAAEQGAGDRGQRAEDRGQKEEQKTEEQNRS
jgi:hypothetical protein